MSICIKKFGVKNPCLDEMAAVLAVFDEGEVCIIIVYSQIDQQCHSYDETWPLHLRIITTVITLRSLNLIDQQQSSDLIDLYFIFQLTPVRIHENFFVILCNASMKRNGQSATT